MGSLLVSGSPSASLRWRRLHIASPALLGPGNGRGRSRVTKHDHQRKGDVMTRLEEIEAELAALDKAVSVLRGEKQRLLDEAAGIAVGDVVRSTTGRRGQVTRIRHVRHCKPRVDVTLFRKDGTLGQRQTYFYEWEKEA